MTNPISSFSGPHRFLSNFWSVEVTLDGVVYHSVENAYQAAKTLDRNARSVLTYCTAGDAKRIGKGFELRPDWENIKLAVMEDLLRQKFSQEPHRSRLLETVGRELVEGNWWGDTFWGVCQGFGENHLGKLLMKIRDEYLHTSG